MVPELVVVPLEVSPPELEAPVEVEVEVEVDVEVEVAPVELVESTPPLEALVPLLLVMSWLPPLLQAQIPNSETTAMDKALRIFGSWAPRRF